MATLREAELILGRIAVDIEEGGLEIRQDVARRFALGVIADTPRATGKAVSNYNGSIGAPDFRVRETEGTSGRASLIRIEAAIQQLRSGVNLFISNCVAYIGRLNAGSSRQAPAMFVERNVMRAVARTEGEIRTNLEARFRRSGAR